MQIKITYDASVANAPKGFKAAVNAAVNYFDQTFSTPITVNIQVGWGEVGGYALGPSDLGASITTLVSPVLLTPQGWVSDLRDTTTEPAILDAAINLDLTAPSGTDAPSTEALPFAEARVFGIIPADNSVPDGYIGFSAAASYTFDPNNRAVAGKYDAIGVIEHEISEVLGRQALDGLPPPEGGSPQYAPLDFFRYSAPGVHTYTPGGAYLSLNGDQLLLPFNDPSNGGDAGDWSTAVSGDSFEAFGETGTEMSVSAVDLRVMELLGYQISYTAPTPNGVPVSPQTVSADLKVASSKTLAFDGPRAIMLDSAATVENSGSIIDTGLRSMTDVVGISGGSSSSLGVTNSATGVLSVTATAQAADAVGADGYAIVSNSGLIQVVSQQADAWGFIGNAFTNNSGGTLSVQAADHATGVNYSWFDGGAFVNAGTIEATGLHAIGVEGATSFNNTGTLEATGEGTGATSAAVFITASGLQQVTTYTNSGTIEGQYAFQVDPLFENSGTFADTTIVNSGTIKGIIALSESNSEIDNSGSITGAIYFGDGNSIYNGVGGKQSGGIFLGHGNNTVTLGNDGEAVVGGGGSDAITGGSGNDFIEIARGNNTIDGGGGYNSLSFADADLGVTVNLGNGTASAAGTDTIKNVQEVIGSNYGNTLIAGTRAVTFVAGAGHDTLTGGAGSDTLIAGPGGDTMTGGGGNDTFIYSAGDRQLVVNDFDANGDHDILKIYGYYKGGQTVTQQGSDTLITLSATDSILLKNVQASSVAAGSNVFYFGQPYQAPTVPVTPPVFGTTPIHFSYDLTISAGETVNEANQNTGFSDDADMNSQLHVLDNYGSISVSEMTGNVVGVQSNVTGAREGGVINEAGATFSITDSDPAGVATGIYYDLESFTNSGLFSVAAQGDAYGFNVSDTPIITNTATGVFSVASVMGDATGIYAHNGDSGFGSIHNDGGLHVTGDLSAYGIRTDRFGGPVSGTSIVNNGDIVVDGQNAATQCYGIYVAPDSVITNTGTITAQTAIDGFGFAPPESIATFSITNSGTINGTIVLTAANSQIHNTGVINGTINFGDGDCVYDGAGGTQTGGIYLGSGKNIVTLGNGGESAFGGGGTDTITGGSGNDFIEIGRGYNVVDGGGGTNTLSFADADMGVSVDLGKGTAYAAGTDKIKNIQVVIGSNFNDTLIAGATAATLIAGSGHDILMGGAGNDTLVAGAGGDRITGGGGNDTFIYSAGDHQLVINDFDANGNQDVLKIFGYASATSMQQIGANTQIKLSSGDTILLKNVQASSLNSSNLIFNNHPYQAPAVPPSPPIFFSSKAPTNIDYALDDGLKIYKGESVQIVSHTGDLNLNVNMGIWDTRASTGNQIVPVLDNFGTVNITSSDDSLFGLYAEGYFGTLVITNEAQATFSVTDTGGSAIGIYGGLYANGQITNAGTINVNALTSATGIFRGAFTNTAQGALNVISSTADAVGVNAQLKANVENDGAIVVNAATTATGITSLYDVYHDGFDQGSIVNNGTIIALSSDPNGETFGIDVSYSYNVDGVSYITNTGTITAKTAIMNADSGDGYVPISMSNSGTINGDVNMGGSDSQLANAGTINGNVIFLTVTKEISSASLFGILPPALTNSGAITGNIFLNGSNATITNTGTIVSSDIELGTGGTLNTLGGSVEIGQGVTAVSGTIDVGIGGTLEGAGAIKGNLAELGGIVEAVGGVLSISGNITGTGQLLIGDTATLDIAGSDTAAIGFAGVGTLRLHDAKDVRGSISGLQLGDTIDLASFKATQVSLQAGILTATDSSGHKLTFHVSGALAGNQFSIQNDSGSGSNLVLVSDTQAASTSADGFLFDVSHSPLTQNEISELITLTSHFGEHDFDALHALPTSSSQYSDLLTFEREFNMNFYFHHADYLV